MAEIKSVHALVEHAERLQKFKDRYGEKIKVAAERGVATVSGLAGGLASGAIRGMGYSKIPRTDIDTDLALGGAGVLAAVAGFGGKQADPMLVFSLCMMAGSLSRGAEHAVGNWKSTH